MNAHDLLLNEVYSCKLCPTRYGFTSLTPGAPYLKFPPTIGAKGKCDLLFVGINPRLSNNNELFKLTNSSPSNFTALAENLVAGLPYINQHGQEAHYHHHVRIVEALYGKGVKFEDYAAVTELFFCGTKNSSGLPQNLSPCADLYFERVFLKVRPKIVICVWKTAFNYLRSRFHADFDQSFVISIQGHSAIAAYLPHPNSRRRY